MKVDSGFTDGNKFKFYNHTTKALRCKFIFSKKKKCRDKYDLKDDQIYTFTHLFLSINKLHKIKSFSIMREIMLC